MSFGKQKSGKEEQDDHSVSIDGALRAAAPFLSPLYVVTLCLPSVFIYLFPISFYLFFFLPLCCWVLSFFLFSLSPFLFLLPAAHGRLSQSISATKVNLPLYRNSNGCVRNSTTSDVFLPLLDATLKERGTKKKRFLSLFCISIWSSRDREGSCSNIVKSPRFVLVTPRLLLFAHYKIYWATFRTRIYLLEIGRTQFH